MPMAPDSTSTSGLMICRQTHARTVSESAQGPEEVLHSCRGCGWTGLRSGVVWEEGRERRGRGAAGRVAEAHVDEGAHVEDVSQRPDEHRRPRPDSPHHRRRHEPEPSEADVDYRQRRRPEVLGVL